MKTTMKQFDCNSMRLPAASCALIALLALATPAVAQQTAPAQAGKAPVAAATAPAISPAARAAQEEETAAPNSSKDQGIKVHGHWVLQVKKADGTLGERREFNNSLTTVANSSAPTRRSGPRGIALRECKPRRSGGRPGQFGWSDHRPDGGMLHRVMQHHHYERFLFRWCALVRSTWPVGRGVFQPRQMGAQRKPHWAERLFVLYRGGDLHGPVYQQE